MSDNMNLHIDHNRDLLTFNMPEDVAYMIDKYFRNASAYEEYCRYNTNRYCIEGVYKVDQFVLLLRNIEVYSQEHQIRNFVYRVRFRIHGDPELETESGSGLHGFRVKGKICSIDCGVDLCILSFWEVNNDNKPIVVSEQDVRDFKHVETDEMGIIHIYKKHVTSAYGKWKAHVVNKIKGLDGSIAVHCA